MIGVFTHAFDFYYKALPTGSNQLTSIGWYDESYFNYNENNAEYIRRWFNFLDLTGSYPIILTRNVPVIPDTVRQTGALPWASAAGDYLWNVLTPSMSIIQVEQPLAGRWYTYYKFTYNSGSFFRANVQPYNTLGVSSYPITSSWIAYEPRMYQFASGPGTLGYRLNGYALFDGGWNGDFFPATLNDGAYSLPTARATPLYDPFVGENPTHITYGSNSTGSNDGRFFDLAGGCGITRTSISESLVIYEANKSGGDSTSRNLVATSLKKRRLFFPTVRTGSMNLGPNAPGIWFQRIVGRPSDQVFTENGGIYNVRFNIKRDITNGFYPDSGEGSELLVFIHNVNANAPSPGSRTPGATGWYPPEANIVRIKNDPAMTFANPGTGFLIESFNINVVQYGFPAQLVFEASGSLASNKYFGCIIDDVQFCKIGVTTDPALIKPTTTGNWTMRDIIAAEEDYLKYAEAVIITPE